MSAYSHPAAEYVKVLERRFKVRLWKERAIWALLNLAWFAPLFMGWFERAPV